MTSPSPLHRLGGPGKCSRDGAPDAKEFAGLVRSGLARLKDAENTANSLGGQIRSRVHALTRCAWRRWASRVPASRRYMSFRCSRTHWASDPKCGESCRSATTCGIGRSTKVTLDVDERLVGDLIGACRNVAGKVRQLPPIPRESRMFHPSARPPNSPTAHTGHQNGTVVTVTKELGATTAAWMIVCFRVSSRRPPVSMLSVF